MAQYDLNLRDYWRILRKRKWSVAFITLAFGGLAFLFAQVEKPSSLFQATAVVKFERATTLVGLMVETISLAQGDSITTQAAVVRSFSVLERAAKAFAPPDRIHGQVIDPATVAVVPRHDRPDNRAALDPD